MRRWVLEGLDEFSTPSINPIMSRCGDLGRLSPENAVFIAFFKIMAYIDNGDTFLWACGSGSKDVVHLWASGVGNHRPQEFAQWMQPEQGGLVTGHEKNGMPGIASCVLHAFWAFR
jgi:hypothetical protein